MDTYEIHKKFGVCNKSEDENNLMKNKFQIFPIIAISSRIPFLLSSTLNTEMKKNINLVQSSKIAGFVTNVILIYQES
jgi:hypothetical protein